jgi:hypothetical protein
VRGSIDTAGMCSLSSSCDASVLARRNTSHLAAWSPTAKSGWDSAIVLLVVLFVLFVHLVGIEKAVSGKSGFHVFNLDLVKVGFVDGGRWLRLDDLVEDTVVEMLVELLGVQEGEATSGALAGDTLWKAWEGRARGGWGRVLGGWSSCHVRAWRGLGGWATRAAGALLAATVRWSLLNIVNGHQMSLEDICAVEGLFGGKTGAWAETADHGTLVMGEGMSLAIVLSREPLLGVLAGSDWALFWSLALVSKLMSAKVTEDLVALEAEVVAVGSRWDNVANDGRGSADATSWRADA